MGSDLLSLGGGEGVGLPSAYPSAVLADVAADLNSLDLKEVGDILAGVGLLLSICGGSYFSYPFFSSFLFTTRGLS